MSLDLSIVIGTPGYGVSNGFFSLLIRRHQSTRLDNAEVTYFTDFIYRLLYGRIIAIPKSYCVFGWILFSTIKLVWTCQSTYLPFTLFTPFVQHFLYLICWCVWIFQPRCDVVFILSTISSWLQIVCVVSAFGVLTSVSMCVGKNHCWKMCICTWKSSCP